MMWIIFYYANCKNILFEHNKWTGEENVWFWERKLLKGKGSHNFKSEDFVEKIEGVSLPERTRRY